VFVLFGVGEVPRRIIAEAFLSLFRKLQVHSRFVQVRKGCVKLLFMQ
jgi:hypothetical protein